MVVPDIVRDSFISTYVIFVFLLTPAPFSADTKNTLIPDLNLRFLHQNTLIHFFFDKRLKIWTPALPVVPGTNLRYAYQIQLSIGNPVSLLLKRRIMFEEKAKPNMDELSKMIDVQ